MEELIKAYEEYIRLLGEEIECLVPIAFLHGFKSDKFLKGKELRDKIKDLKDKLGIQ